MDSANVNSLGLVSADYLENVGGSVSPQVQPAEVSGEVPVSQNFDLESLDSGQGVGEIGKIEQYSPHEIDEEPEVSSSDDDFIKRTDVRLDDIIARFFDKAERPIVVVCDDKIEYANDAFCKIVECSEKEVLEQNFFSFVDEDDWGRLAENIGVMLTEGKSVNANLKSKTSKLFEVSLEAVYLSDASHFAFAMVGNWVSSPNKEQTRKPEKNVPDLYDEVTGLPSFYLFEDRVQMAINYENYKDVRLRKNIVAAIAVSVDNIFVLKELGISDFVLKKLASKLAFSLKKNYTIARGLAYEFWILMNDVSSTADLDIELRKLNALFAEPIRDNITDHNVSVSIGVSIFPDVAKSAKKLLEQTIKAVKKAQERGGGIAVYSDDTEHNLVN